MDEEMAKFLQMAMNQMGQTKPTPGINPVGNDPYAFNPQNFMPQGMGGIGQMLMQFAPQALSYATGDSSYNQRLVSNNNAYIGNIRRNRQTQEMMQNFNRGAGGAMRQNFGSLLSKTGLVEGEDANTAAQFLIDMAPALDPRMAGILNKMDPAGGSIGLGAALYQNTISGVQNTKVTGATARILGDQFQKNFTTQQGDFRLLDTDKTSGLTMPQMAVMRQQMRSRGMVGDVLSGTDSASVLRSFAGEAGGESRDQLMALAANVDKGGISGEAALVKAEQDSLITSGSAETRREKLISSNLGSETGSMSEMARSIQEAGSIFETLADNVPALMQQVENMTGNLKATNPAEIRKKLGEFQALVEISGTTAEVLATEIQNIQSRTGANFSRALEASASTDQMSRQLQEGGMSEGMARQTASKNVLDLQQQSLRTNTTQVLALASKFATPEGKKRLKRAVEENDTEFLSNPIASLEREGLMDNANAAKRARDRVRTSGYRMDEDTANDALKAIGVDSGSFLTDMIRKESMDRIGGDFISRGISDTKEMLKLDELSEDQFGSLYGLSAQIMNKEVSVKEAAALASQVLGREVTASEMDTLAISMEGTEKLNKRRRKALGSGGITADMNKEGKVRTKDERDKIAKRTEKELAAQNFDRGLPTLLKKLTSGEDMSLTEILDAGLVAAGFALDKDQMKQVDSDLLKDADKEVLQNLADQIRTEDDPEKREKLYEDFNNIVTEVGLTLTDPEELQRTNKEKAASAGSEVDKLEKEEAAIRAKGKEPDAAFKKRMRNAKSKKAKADSAQTSSDAMEKRAADKLAATQPGEAGALDEEGDGMFSSFINTMTFGMLGGSGASAGAGALGAIGSSPVSEEGTVASKQQYEPRSQSMTFKNARIVLETPLGEVAAVMNAELVQATEQQGA